MTLHTKAGCNLNKDVKPSSGNGKAYTGKVLGTNCDAKANHNGGCGVLAADDDTFGAGVKKNGYVVYAMLWDQEGVKIWNFKKGKVPKDLTDGAPDPSTWPTPDAFWSPDTCKIDQFFKEHVIVINTTLCG